MEIEFMEQWCHCGDGADDDSDGQLILMKMELSTMMLTTDCYNGDDIAMNLVNDGNEDCSMGEMSNDGMMFDDCRRHDGSSRWR